MSIKHGAIRFPDALTDEEKQLPIVYCFLWSAEGMEGGKACAMSADGEILISKMSQNQEDAWRKTGYLVKPDEASEAHSVFLGKYPDGCRLKWVLMPEKDKELQQILESI